MERAPRPFFLVIHTSDPHDPYDPPEEFDRYMPGYQGSVDGFVTNYPPAQLDDADRRRIRSLYDGEIAFNDHSFGSLIDHMRGSGIYDDTLTIVTSDHGEEFWEYGLFRRGHGHDLTQAQIRVPLIVSLPRSQRVPQGVRVSRAVQLVDLVPSILDLADLPVPSGLDGQSLFVEGDLHEPRSLFSTTLLRQPIHGVIEFPWKLVWTERLDRYSLYHLTRPGEKGEPVDARALQGHPAVRKRLQERLRGYVEALSILPESEVVSPEEVPDSVQEALRELGYVE
jgi:arylsulfatase A-like enzyme